MKDLKIIILLLVFSFSQVVLSQEYHGKITDGKTGLPVPFAAVYSKSLGIGVYSNEDGMFLIRSDKALETEELVVSCVGYKSRTLRITGSDCGRIALTPVIYMLNEVRIQGNDAEYRNFKYLDSLFQNYRGHTIQVRSKAYFSFSAEEDSIPLEFQEAYFNTLTSCRNGIEELSLKTGRIGNNEKNFLTVNISDIFLNLKLFSLKENNRIPASPANFRYRNMKRHFQFTTVGVTPEKDKYLMVLEPRSKSVPYFSATLYIDKTKNVIEKIEYSINSNFFYYLYPLLPNDTVKNINLKLIYYFDNLENPYLVRQAGISYGINYYSDFTNRNYFIRGNGKLVLFDPGKQYPLIIPADLFESQNNDYRLISSLPYDSLFWNLPGIAPLSSKNLKYLNFFNIHEVAKTYDPKTREISLSRYMPWKEGKGVGFKDFDSVSRKQNKANGKVHDVYSIQKNSIKTPIVLNYFYLGDSLHLTSVTLIDLVDSYFEPDTGYRMLTYINLNFDLAEAFRRKIINQIYQDKKFQHSENDQEIRKLYEALNVQLADTLEVLKKQTENGTNLEKLMAWLKHMKDKYKIDRDFLAEQMYLEDLYHKGNKDVKKVEM